MKKCAIIITSAAVVVIAAATTATIAIIANSQPQSFRLESEYYAKSEPIDLDKAGYEELIRDKKSFVVMIDKPGCYTTANMRGYMVNFPDDMQFKYYRMMWEEVRESSLHEYVKFTPSVALIREGKVTKWLQADRDEDTEYFESAEALQSWIKKYIEF